GFIAGVELRLDHLGAAHQAFRRQSDAPLPGDVEKARAELALEGAAHGGKVEAHGFDIALAPAPPRLVFERVEKARHGRIGTLHPQHRRASLARAEPRLEAVGGGLAEKAVFPARFAGRAGEATEDAG